MKTRITNKPKKCLKFEGYIYLPSENADRKELLHYLKKTMGRIFVYDEFGKKVTNKAQAFDNLGKMISFIETERKKIISKRVKK